MTPSGRTGSASAQRDQAPPQLAQFAEEGEAEHLGKMVGCGGAAVRPDPQPLAGRGEEGGPERPAVSAAAPVGVDDQLGGRGLDRVGVLQLGVSGERAVDGEQEVPYAVAVSARIRSLPCSETACRPSDAAAFGEQGEDGPGLSESSASRA
ncbi:hypothetical protein SBADM41S_04551 [Streptomyces badius]